MYSSFLYTYSCTEKTDKGIVKGYITSYKTKNKNNKIGKNFNPDLSSHGIKPHVGTLYPVLKLQMFDIVFN